MIKKIFLWILLLTISVSCSNLPTANGSVSAPRTQTEDQIVSDPNTLTISARLKEALSDGESLLLAKVDAITGEMIDPVFYEMRTFGPLVYELNIANPGKGIFRYKYFKVGADQLEELDSSGVPFRSRWFDLDGVTEVSDVISGWENGRFYAANGRVAGTVRSSITDEPISGVEITVQGRTTSTDAFGRYEIAGLPFGTFYVNYFASDLSYKTFQQQAIVESNKVTLADVWLEESVFGDVQLTASFSGNAAPQGNLFLILDPMYSDISEAGSMVKMERTAENSFTTTLKLPVTTSIQYKYSTGDGFWGAEKDAYGKPILRTVSINELGSSVTDMVVMDTATRKTITIHTPTQTPAELPIFIQYNAFGWSEPIELMAAGSNTYITQIEDPSDLINNALVRVCVGSTLDLNCGYFGSGSNEATVDFSNGDPIDLSVTKWEREFISFPASEFETSQPGGIDFEAGLALVSNTTECFSAADLTRVTPGSVMIATSKGSLRFDGYNFAFKPTQFAVSSPDFVEQINTIKSAGLTPWISLNIDSIVDQEGLVSDNVVVENPERLLAAVEQQLMNLVQIANQNNIRTIVIGGDGLAKIINGNSTSDIASSELFNAFWSENFTQIRSHFDGNVYYQVKYNNLGLFQTPSAEFEMDGYLVDWTTSTGDPTDTSVESLKTNINSKLEYDIIPSIPLGKRIIIQANIPADSNAVVGCANNDELNCLSIDGTSGNLDVISQRIIYQAFMTSVSDRDDIEGFISGGFDPRIIGIDGSANVFGKPAFMDLNSWLESVNNK